MTVTIETVRNQITELKLAGKSVAYIKAVVSEETGVSANKIDKVYKEMYPSQPTGAQGDLEALVKVMRENAGKVKREELIKMMAEASGYSESTANHMFSQLNFAKEYHKQMSSKK